MGFVQRNRVSPQPLYFIFLIGIALFCASCRQADPKSAIATVGQLDLTHWNFEADGTLPLAGEWEFYWQQYLRGADFARAPAPKLVQVPSSWDAYAMANGQKLGAEGYATYRLVVILPRQYTKTELLGLKVRFIPTQYALFVQNQPMNHPGPLGTSPATSKGRYDPDTFYFLPQSDTVEIVMHVANYEDRLGGLAQSLMMGKAGQVRKSHETTLMVSFFLFGVLVVMGGYHLSLYFFRPQNKATLWFALLCLVVALRILVTDDYYLTDLFPQAGFEVGKKLSYLTFYLLVPILAIFINTLYPADFAKVVVQICIGLGGLFSVVVLATKGLFYSQFLAYFQLATLLIILYSGYFIVRILRKRREGSLTFAIGIFLVFAMGINDVLFTNLLIQTANLLPLGLFAFIFSQTLILSHKFSHAFNQVETLSEELKLNNQQLETTVQKRTMELREVNEAQSQNLEELSANMDLINDQNRAIRAQNRSMESSISYAKNIQSSILPDMALFQQHFLESFLLFKPKAVVSGDFYYFNTIGHKLILAAVDCTGHGVPGAFMSLIGCEILNEIIDIQQIEEPATILSALHRGVRKLLKQETSGIRDGMDIAVVVIDPQKRELKFAGSKSPFVYVQNKTLTVIKGDNLHIGGSAQTNNLTFTQTVLQLPPAGEFSCYLFSDGYQDQIGGGEVRKLMKKHFYELLHQISAMPMQTQGELLAEWHADWKGKMPQTDDILVMGLRL